MFHGVGFEMPPGQRLEEKILRERLDGIMSDQKRIGDIMQLRSSLNEGQISDLFREARTKDADFAKRVGIIDDIRDIDIPPGDPIISLVFKR